MNAEQITLVRKTWKMVLPISEKAADIFYKRLFEIDPSTRSLFSGNMREQGAQLMNMINTAVEGLDKLDTIVPAVQDLGRRHSGYGVLEQDYQTGGSALLWTLRQGLGAEFTPDVKAAWLEAYTLLADVMTQAAAETANSDEASEPEADNSDPAPLPQKLAQPERRKPKPQWAKYSNQAQPA